jgi:hypothetical protein
MSRSSRGAAMIVAAAVAGSTPAALAAAVLLRAPRSARRAEVVTVAASHLITGAYALTLVSDSHPANGVSCVARLSSTRSTIGGAVKLRGTVPARLTCYQGSAISLGRIATATGAYHLVVAEPTGPAGFDASGSFARSALRITG